MIPKFWSVYRQMPVSGTMPRAKIVIGTLPGVWLLDAMLRGLGQVVLLDNPFVGIAVVIAAFLNDERLAVFGLVGLAASTFFAHIMGLGDDYVRSGLFGYNGYLTGTALGLFQTGWDGDDWSALNLASVSFAAIVSAVLSMGLGNVFSSCVAKPIPSFTLPFHFAVWTWLLSSQRSTVFINTLSDPKIVVPTNLSNQTSPNVDNEVALFDAFIVGIGQIFFFSRWESGLVVLVGMTLASPVAAALAFLGSIIGTLTAVANGSPQAEIDAGLFGYDAALAMEIIAGMILLLTPKSFCWGVLGAVAASVFHGAVTALLTPLGLPALTFPGAITAIVFLLSGDRTFALKLIPSSQQTCPEELLWHAAGRSTPLELPHIAHAFEEGPVAPTREATFLSRVGQDFSVHSKISTTLRVLGIREEPSAN